VSSRHHASTFSRQLSAGAGSPDRIDGRGGYMSDSASDALTCVLKNDFFRARMAGKLPFDNDALLTRGLNTYRASLPQHELQGTPKRLALKQVTHRGSSGESKRRGPPRVNPQGSPNSCVSRRFCPHWRQYRFL
jgi:hypothetical protein